MLPFWLLVAIRTQVGFISVIGLAALWKHGAPFLAFIVSLFRVAEENLFFETVCLAHPLSFECFNCSKKLTLKKKKNYPGEISRIIYNIVI